jgi:GNAT superfamily N-acetyltransferase
MRVDILREDSRNIEEYAAISAAFEVREVLDRASLETLEHTGRPLPSAIAEPYVKDYDAYPRNSPNDWRTRWPLEDWGIFAAYGERRRIGGAIGVAHASDVGMFAGRADIAVLWDLRVAPDVRGRGVASALLRAVEEWATASGARALGVETQNVNVPACRFYSGRGFALERIDDGVYVDLPTEIRLLWTKSLR